jgi:ABC-2 type transport system ATP-binding protein
MMAHEPPAILAQGLTRRFGATVAVRDLALDIPRGEIFALLGPDGAGKTTTLRMLSGAIAPTSGTVVIDGIDLRADPERVHERLGYMPQRFSLYATLTVQENLDFYAELFAVPREVRAERSRRLLEFSGLSAFTGRLAEELSGGMKQKLALACTLVHEPGVLLLDEPTAGVDPVSRREFWRILYELNRQGVTILISTTYMDEADRCTTVGLLYAGELISVEDPGVMKRRMKGDVVEFVAEPKAIARRVIERSTEILSETVIGDRFRMVVADAGAAIPALTQRLTAQGVQVRGVATVPPSLEDVFVSMIAERRAAGGGTKGAAGG